MQNDRNKYTLQKGHAPDEGRKKLPILRVGGPSCAGGGVGPHLTTVCHCLTHGKQ